MSERGTPKDLISKADLAGIGVLIWKLLNVNMSLDIKSSKVHIKMTN